MGEAEWEWIEREIEMRVTMTTTKGWEQCSTAPQLMHSAEQTTFKSSQTSTTEREEGGWVRGKGENAIATHRSEEVRQKSEDREMVGSDVDGSDGMRPSVAGPLTQMKRRVCCV